MLAVPIVGHLPTGVLCIQGYSGQPFQGADVTPGKRIISRISGYYKHSTEINQTEILLSILLIYLLIEGPEESCWEQHHFGSSPENGTTHGTRDRAPDPCRAHSPVLWPGTLASLWNPIIRQDAPQDWRFSTPFGDFSLTSPACSFFSPASRTCEVNGASGRLAAAPFALFSLS